MKIDKEKTKKKNRGGAGDGLFYDNKSKTWGFRVSRDGKDTRRKGFKNKTEAKEARIAFLANYDAIMAQKEEQADIKTFQMVYDHYLTYGAAEKREGTLAKQKSVWKCHLQKVFGEKDIVKTSPGEINNFLVQLYTRGDDYNNYSSGYAYGTVEGILKIFYLFYGYARRMNWVSREKYVDMCEDDSMRITMPKKQDGDGLDEVIETYTLEEIEKMRNRIKNSSLYVAFEIGYYCGLRISECFGLMWDDIDFKNKKMTVRRQMLKSGPHFTLVPCKTTKAVRCIDVPDKLLAILKEHKEKQEENKKNYDTAYKGVETVRVRMKKGQDEPLTGGNFVNRMDSGQLLTSDSMKSWAVKIKKELGIEFRYHSLRHTHASTLAALNVPIPKLMDRLGHKKIETTRKYYFGANEIADQKALEALNSL